MTVKVYVADCHLGKGIFALDRIERGDVILAFVGRLITLAEAIAKGDRSGDPLQLGLDQYMDLEPPGLYANHSCDPNSGIGSGNLLVALRDIEKDEEICYRLLNDHEREHLDDEVRLPFRLLSPYRG